MDSINKNAIEHNKENLEGDAAIKRLKEMVDRAGTCFFCTRNSTGGSDAVRPMEVREVDERGNLWFLSDGDSHKNREIESDHRVDLYFQGSHSEFLHIRGMASVSRDKERIKALWNPLIKTWFTEGVDDPRITVIKVAPADGYYWDTKHGMAIAGIKMLIGAALGKTMDDSIEGKVRVRT